MKQSLLRNFLLLSILASCSALERPNIVIFYIDDLGWQDVEKLNDIDSPSPYETPNLVKLAKRGINFSQGYSPAPTCAPSRAAILSGLHPAATRYTHVTASLIPQQHPSRKYQEPFLGAYFDLDHPMLSEALKNNDYVTGHYGKWHTGLNATAYGFDHVNQTRGVHSGMKDRTKDFPTAEDDRWPLSKEKYPPYSEQFPDGISYPHDELTESALEFIANHKEQPFFLNLCHWMVHWPVLTRNKELLQHYCTKMGHPFPLEPGAMTLEGQQNPYFASMVTTVDWSLGKLMHYLEQTDDPRHPGSKLIDTTYIFFTSDNGGVETKGSEIISDNAPLRYGKKYTEEGGIRVPLVIAGPGIAPGSESHEPINQLDFFPTILSLTHTTFPSENAKNLAGLDISPLLNGQQDFVTDQNGARRESLFWHFPHNDSSMKSALRKGDYKLYRNYKTEDYSLYRLYQDGQRADLEEQHDLIKDPAYQTIGQELIAELNGYLIHTKAELPHLNPHYKNAKTTPATIGVTTFTKGNRAQVTVSNTPIKEAYILYYCDPENAKKTKSNDYTNADPAIPYEVKVPAQISVDGHTVSAPVPDEVRGIRFILIDQQNYGHFTELLER